MGARGVAVGHCTATRGTMRKMAGTEVGVGRQAAGLVAAATQVVGAAPVFVGMGVRVVGALMLAKVEVVEQPAEQQSTATTIWLAQQQLP